MERCGGKIKHNGFKRNLLYLEEPPPSFCGVSQRTHLGQIKLLTWLNKHTKKTGICCQKYISALAILSHLSTRKQWLCLLIMSDCMPRSGLDIITVWKEKHVWLPLCFPISLAGSGSLSVISHIWPVGQPISPHVANSLDGWEWLAAIKVEHRPGYS